MYFMRRISAALLLSTPLLAAACATTGATLGSGVGDAYLEHPPFYAGVRLAQLGATRSIGYLPAVYQRGASQAPIFDPSLSDALQQLLTDMTSYLDSADIGVKLAEGGRVSAVSHAATLHPPDVRFGCVTESGNPDDDCADRGDVALGRGSQPMKLSVGRPSAEWTAWMGEVMEGAGVDHVLLVTLEVGQYWTRQRGLLGRKEVELGTDHVASFPWLTSLETPVAVIQLTGALVGRNGKAIRIGAEGLTARRTPLLVSALGGQAIITDEEVRALRSDRRQDLPGEPLVWQAALQNLVAQLTGR